ncbi:MAG: hypothetical protein MZV70_70210 [Desulfobacterales bacterium]|nr:hypothetical protein [Desulfobacterales bacterium]
MISGDASRPTFRCRATARRRGVAWRPCAPRRRDRRAVHRTRLGDVPVTSISSNLIMVYLLGVGPGGCPAQSRGPSHRSPRSSASPPSTSSSSRRS